MQTYKVGGAVRDQLLGITASDTDYVVVGSSKKEMLELGFKEVGRDFPVFLHPKTHEEYALARCEKKTARGHTGFLFDVSTNVSLVDDLKRRDITINAMAMDGNGKLIDPFGGENDLKQKIIRHVSPSFIEDPLRVLRVARFSAKFDFVVADETLELMQKIVATGELKTLSHERISEEIGKALITKHIINFFNILNQVGALQQLLLALVNVAASEEFRSALMALNNKPYSLEQRFALLYFYMYQEDPRILPDELPKYQNPKSIKFMYAPNNKCRRIATLLINYYDKILTFDRLDAIAVYDMITQIDPFRHKDSYIPFLDLITLLASIKNDDKVKQHLETLEAIILSIKNIDYTKLDNSDKSKFIAQIKQIKLDIINARSKL